MTVCLHCNRPCRLTTGKEVYPDHPKLSSKKIWKCDPCDAHVGCHGDSSDALGFAADYSTRRARSLLHERRLDPIWKAAPRKRRHSTRLAVYRFLSEAMCLPPEETHTTMFTIEQCREAWVALEGHDYRTIIFDPQADPGKATGT